MFKTRISLGTVFGIPLRIDISWLLIFVWVTWSFAGGYFAVRYPEWSGVLRWSAGIVASLAFFGSVLLHELGHALLARRMGMPVHDITLFVFGGVAEIVDEPRTPASEFLMALVGPLISLALSGILATVHLVTRGFSEPIAAIAFVLGLMNLALGVFNLIPGFPLDGGRVLRSILWNARQDLLWATRWASRVGQVVAYGFILVGIVRFFSGNWLGGLWIALIGLFLDNAARTSYAQLTLRNLLEDYAVSDIMERECLLLPHHLSVESFIEQYLLGSGRRCYTVGDERGISGLLTVHNVRTVPKVDRPFISIAEVQTPLEELHVVGPDTSLWEALQIMGDAEVNQLPVLMDGQLVGLLTRQDLLRFIRARSALAE
ncbi:MAG: site-2 protease family protein [Chloroflexi bacterium]|nr:site-2 protease family protein [Chloroflexota bacterium]